MPNSLKCKIKHLCHNRTITESECDRILKALEQEPCEDAISREATLKPYKGLNDEDTICVWLIRKNIEQQPSVNPQKPNAGHWIKYGKLYQCSECKELSCCQGKFCDECGAKMIEPQESEE